MSHQEAHKNEISQSSDRINVKIAAVRRAITFLTRHAVVSDRCTFQMDVGICSVAMREDNTRFVIDVMH